MATRVIDGKRDAALFSLLDAAWEQIFARGGIEYDPSTSGVGIIGPFRPFRFLYVPGRSRRPGAQGAPLGGVARAHLPCPFDDAAAIERREALRLSRAGRIYHLIANRFPVKRLHFLAVRDAGAPPASLGQCIAGTDEIEDMLGLARMLGPPMRLYFNSNSGADGSDSGSSVNHWHFQLFPDAEDVLEDAEPAPIDAGGGAPSRAMRLEAWPAAHRIYRDHDLAALAAALWDDVRRAVALDIAYTLVFKSESGASVTAAVFPRAPIAPPAIAGVGALPNRFGGFELVGAVMLYEPALAHWAGAHPREAQALARERLRGATRDIW
jgi:hypothetical protein